MAEDVFMCNFISREQPIVSAVLELVYRLYVHAYDTKKRKELLRLINNQPVYRIFRKRHKDYQQYASNVHSQTESISQAMRKKHLRTVIILQQELHRKIKLTNNLFRTHHPQYISRILQLVFLNEKMYLFTLASRFTKQKRNTLNTDSLFIIFVYYGQCFNQINRIPKYYNINGTVYSQQGFIVEDHPDCCCIWKKDSQYYQFHSINPSRNGLIQGPTGMDHRIVKVVMYVKDYTRHAITGKICESQALQLSQPNKMQRHSTCVNAAQMEDSTQNNIQYINESAEILAMDAMTNHNAAQQSSTNVPIIRQHSTIVCHVDIYLT